MFDYRQVVCDWLAYIEFFKWLYKVPSFPSLPSFVEPLRIVRGPLTDDLFNLWMKSLSPGCNSSIKLDHACKAFG